MAGANDAFASPTVLTGTSGTAGIDNSGASYETGEPANDLGADGAASVWYEWTLGASAYGTGWDLTLDTDSSPAGWDSTLEVFTGSTLTGLTLVASADDIDYPTNPRTLLTCTVPDSTTVRIRVDGWTPISETAAGILTYGAVSAPPPAPTMTIWVSSGTYDLHYAFPGDDLIVTGTHLDTVSTATVGGVSQPFTAISPTELHIHINSSAVTGLVHVLNVSGDAYTFDTCHVLYPGPWVTAPEQTTTDTSNSSTQAIRYGDTDILSDTQPDPVGLGIASAGNDFAILSGEWPNGDGTYTYTWSEGLVVIVLDERDGTFTMPDYDPAAEIAADPHAVDYETNTADTPVPTSDLTIEFDFETFGGEYWEDSDSRTLAEDLWQMNVEWRRLDDTDWDFGGLGDPFRPVLTPDAWPVLTGKTLDFTRPLIHPGDTLDLTSPTAHWTDNRADLSTWTAWGYGGATVVSWTDFGTTRAWAVTFDVFIDGTPLTPPRIDPDPTLHDHSNKFAGGNVNVRGTWTYQPRRYRLLYDTPPAATAPHTLRRRQQASAVGSAPRRRQIASRAGSPRRGPGAPR